MKTIKFQEFQKTFKQLQDSKTKFIMLITSGADEEGHYWCKDCGVIAPFYQQFQGWAQKLSIPFYAFTVDRPTWKDQKCVLRTNKAILATRVPTLGYFNGRRLVHHMIQKQLLDPKQRTMFFETIVEEKPNL